MAFNKNHRLTVNSNLKPAKCKLNENECLTLLDILKSFNSPISEEHVWALCYQCAKCIKNSFKNNPNNCKILKRLDQVTIHKDGYVHPKSVFYSDDAVITPDGDTCDKNIRSSPSEQKILAGLSYVIFQAFDFGIEEDEERAISPQLEKLLNCMIHKEEKQSENDRLHQPETDDEGIEKDSGDLEDDAFRRLSSQHITLDRVLQLCASHAGVTEPEEADSHYRAVCRALVAEAIELSSFLQKVSESGTSDLRLKTDTTAPSEALDCLNFQDWARLWIQVIRELRHGVNLKKITYNRTPIEYELTPYEILMEDIRSRRYKLNKVMINGNIPAPVKKDAHAIILEFIRSRPPLKKASDRKLPPRIKQTTPREKLLESIKQGDVKLRRSISPAPKRIVPCDSKTPYRPIANSFQQRQGSTRRLIKVDYSAIQNLVDDDDDDDNDEIMTRSYTPSSNGKINNNDSFTQQNPMYRTAYDLATQCPRIRTRRRHTIVCSPTEMIDDVLTAESMKGNDDVAIFMQNSLSNASPEIAWSRSSLQDDLFESKQWQEECLSLNLEEVVHIRSVLTKAELEGLPVEGHVKEDVEKRKVCFLCLKTRFSIFGPWGQICKLCSRTVCSKCYCKMRIPTEHFAHIPVIALSPTLLSPTETDGGTLATMSASATPTHKLNVPSIDRGIVGSAPVSPKMYRYSQSNNMSVSRHIHIDDSSPQSLPTISADHNISIKRSRLDHNETRGRLATKDEKLRGLEMIVCSDCKAMVIQIIKSSRINRTNLTRYLTLNLSPVD